VEKHLYNTIWGIKPLLMKSLLQNGVNRKDKVPCSIPCNMRTGKGVDDIPSHAQCTWGSNLPVERQSLINLLIWNRCTICGGHIKINGINGRILSDWAQVLGILSDVSLLKRARERSLCGCSGAPPGILAGEMTRGAMEPRALFLRAPSIATSPEVATPISSAAAEVSAVIIRITNK
jgi:hypothetical protein